MYEMLFPMETESNFVNEKKRGKCFHFSYEWARYN